MEIIVIVFSPTYKSLFKQMIRDQAHFFKHGLKSRIKIYKSVIIFFLTRFLFEQRSGYMIYRETMYRVINWSILLMACLVGNKDSPRPNPCKTTLTLMETEKHYFSLEKQLLLSENVS